MTATVPAPEPGPLAGLEKEKEKAVEGAPYRFHLYRVDVNDWSPV